MTTMPDEDPAEVPAWRWGVRCAREGIFAVEPSRTAAMHDLTNMALHCDAPHELVERTYQRRSSRPWNVDGYWQVPS